MTHKLWQKNGFIPAFLLMTWMVITRSQHFGDAVNLPDASLAVFFFAGFVGNIGFFVLLLAAAFAIDFIAIDSGTSAFCISPAYLFLLPAYRLMWAAGRFCKELTIFQRPKLASAMTIFTSATVMAFVISNCSFYWLSGRIDNLSWGHFVGQFNDYFWPYITSSLSYGLAGFLFIKFYKFLIGSELTEKSV